MKLSNKKCFILFALLVLFNIVLRFQVIPREIGVDSFFMHVVTNSLSEFGSAKWYLHPLSLAGLYPYSYASSVPFLLSGIFQITALNMNHVIFLYCLFLGIFSLFTSYLMAGTVLDDDIYKLLVAIWFSTSPAVLTYSTWTIPSRGLLIIMAPLLFYLLVKFAGHNLKYFILIILVSGFLFTTHHLFYFLIPVFFSFVVIELIFKLKVNTRISEVCYPAIIIFGFLIMFSIPFIGGKFLESSRYAPLVINYARYIGLPIIFIFGGVSYLIFKSSKNYAQWLMLFSATFLLAFIYKLTYMKMFISVFAIPFAAFGFINITRASLGKRNLVLIISLILILSSCFVGYYQFLHVYDNSKVADFDRVITHSTYSTGIWMKNNINGSSISNNDLMSLRISSVAENVHFLSMYSILDQVYGFMDSNISSFHRYSISSEEFWYSGYEDPDLATEIYINLNTLKYMPQEYNIFYIVEDTKAHGNIIWSNHSPMESKLIGYVKNENSCIYDIGDIKVWDLHNN